MPSASPPTSSPLRDGVRAGLPLVLPTLAVGASFGVLAEPVMGSVAPVVMSIIVFAGSAQFAALSVLATGGGAGAAVVAGMLLNTRFVPMGFAFAPSLRGGPLARAAKGQLLVDASFALASRGGGRFDPGILFGATAIQAAGWIGGTALGVAGGSLIADPEQLGLDALFPAFYLALLAEEAGAGESVRAALLGAGIAFVLLPVAPPGVPVIAASLAALVGLRRA